MKAFAKTMSIIIGLLDHAVGIALAVILILNRHYFAVILIEGMGYYELLLFNAVVFTAILAAIGIALSVFAGEYKKSDKPVEFPLIYEALPVIVAGITIFYVLQNGVDTREKVLTTVMALLYAALSAVVILYASKVLRLFPKEK